METRCEACFRPAEYKHLIEISSPKTSIEIRLCKRHFKMVVSGAVSDGELIYIHNCYVAGQRKEFLK